MGNAALTVMSVTVLMLLQRLLASQCTTAPDCKRHATSIEFAHWVASTICVESFDATHHRIGTLMTVLTARCKQQQLCSGCCTVAVVLISVHVQALSLGYAVKMQGAVPGRTPAVITPPFISPAAANEPGATPMNDGTPQVPPHLACI